MKYLKLNTTDPYYNLAVEEYLFRHDHGDVFMLWQNRPSVIIGKNQNAYAEVDLDYAAAKGITVARRITGGGAVYHDLGNLNYSFITSSDSPEIPDQAYFTKPIIDALAELGVECTLSGRNDIECNGRKISGNAQTKDGERILHHGTLLFDVNTDEMAAVLRIDKEKLEYRAIASHKSRVTNLSGMIPGLSVNELARHIENKIIGETGAEVMTPPENGKVASLAARNGSKEWIFSDRRFLTGYTVRRKKRFPFGTVSVELSLNGDTIEGAVISGDFFGTKPINELEKSLVGKHLAEVEFGDVSDYISRMTPDELCELIKG